MKVALYVLGEKGNAVLAALAGSLPQSDFVHVCIGTDANVTDDFSQKSKALCESAGLPFSVGNSHSLGGTPFDFALAIGWRWLIKDVPEEKLIVFHDSCLPRYRGFAPLVNALLNREAKVGVTALRGAFEYDRGNILLQEAHSVQYPTTIGSEITRISGLYTELAIKLFRGLKDGGISIDGTPQNENEASYSLWRDEDDYAIDWSKSAEEILHFISCVGEPYLFASTMVSGKKVRIANAAVVPDVKVENRDAGKIIFMDNGKPVVVCGKGLLKLTDVRGDDGQSLLPWTKFRTKFR